MTLAHIMASGMGGIRTAGDLVAWMQLSRRMRISEAKNYVAEKLGVSLTDLTDEDVMNPLRKELGLTTVTQSAGEPVGMEAKLSISKLLGIEINSVIKYKDRIRKFFA